VGPRLPASAAALALVVALGCGGGSDATQPVVPPPIVDPALPQTYVPTGRASAGDVFVHLFEWRWLDVARECEVWLGPKGFAAVQVSPPTEHAIVSNASTSYPWWQRYQPVSYRLDRSRSGTAAEFSEMVQRCRAAGVGIYVDAVINHMTAGSGIGSAGGSYTKYDYPAVPWVVADFHTPCSIDSYNSATQVQGCELVGLSDLRTESETVRDRLAAYLVAMTQLGVAGFRIDAAKHIAPRDLDAIVTRVNAAATAAGRARPYVFLEVINNPGEAVTAQQYFGVGNASGGASDVTDFLYGYRVTDAFTGRNGATLAGVLPSLPTSLLPGDKSVVFVDNHDNQRGDNLRYALAGYEPAVVFMLAHPHGYPSVMSSYGFERNAQRGRDAGPPSEGAGVTQSTFNGDGTTRCTITLGSTQLDRWICEHRRPAIASMVAFRRAAAGTPISACGRADWTIGGDVNRIAFCRDGAGFLALSRSGTTTTETLPTRLPAGRYCNVVRDDYVPARAGQPASCSGPPVEVQGDGSAAIPLGAAGMVALHTGARVN
jgi:alpha-amylase